VVLAALAALAAVAAIVALYLRDEVADRDAFATRATAALQDSAVRDVAAREIVVGLVERGSPDLVTARPLLESAVGAVVGTGAFSGLVRGAALQAHSLLFDRGGDAFVLDLADTGTVMLSAVRSLAPDVAARLPQNAGTTLVDLRNRTFADRTLHAADTVRTWALILPFLALALLAAALALARDRGRALTVFGLGLGVAATIAEIALATARTLTLRGLHGSDAIPADDLRAAAGGVWDAFLGDLGGLLLICAVVGFVLAAGVLSAIDPDAVRRQAARVVRRPDAPLALGARGVIVAGAGLLVLVEPDLALRIIAYILGAALVYAGATELLTALGRAGYRLPERQHQQGEPPPGAARRRLAVTVLTAVLTLVLASGAAALVLHEGKKATAAAPASGCNGSKSLCDRRLNEVLFPGTHNSMGAADVAGWTIPDQRRAIPRQLADGIRLFLIDPHYGRTLSGGRVQTDFAGEGRDANKVAKELDDSALAALDRLGLSITRTTSAARGPREVWLCHTVCELGATRLTDTLTQMRRYLEANPGAVLMLVLESYVRDSSLRQAFDQTDTTKYAETLRRGEPLPTLGDLVASGRRMVVFTEQAPDGSVPWLNSAFQWIQDTPLGNRAAGDFTCRRFRGTATSPMLMLNNWVERFPPSPTAQRPVLTQAFLTRRIQECQRERGLPVTGVAVDFYDEGDLVEVASAHNQLPVYARP
jgi:hypothetical protein